MRITAVRLRRVRGTLPTKGNIWEERLVRPLDVYPEYRNRNDHEGGVQTEGGFKISTVFLQIDTDEGVQRHRRPDPRAGGLYRRPQPAPLSDRARRHRRREAVGPDASRHGAWPPGRRDAGNQRGGLRVVGSAREMLGQPVYRLLGGPTRESIPAYASMLGFAVLDPVRVRDRAQEYKQLGYTAQKWFFRPRPDERQGGAAQEHRTGTHAA